MKPSPAGIEPWQWVRADVSSDVRPASKQASRERCCSSPLNWLFAEIKTLCFCLSNLHVQTSRNNLLCLNLGAIIKIKKNSYMYVAVPGIYLSIDLFNGDRGFAATGYTHAGKSRERKSLTL